MNINTAFASSTLRAADIEDGDMILTIAKVEIETVGQGKDAEDKPCVYFEETDKKLVLNKTNGKAIAGMYGGETDDWAGKKIALFPTEVQYGDTMTMGIRVRLKPPGGAKSPASKQAGNRPPISPVASKNPRMIAWMAFCDVTPNFEQDHRAAAWASAIAEDFPGKSEKTLTAGEWATFAAHVRESYSEESEGFIPI